MKWEQYQHMLEDWLKAFVAVLIADGWQWRNALSAGLAAVLPMIYAWANTKDTRYGRK